jgi:FtsZ-binding cell division protein ZapB
MIDCWGLVNFDEFKQKIAQGWVVTTLPNKAEVTVSLLTSFKAIEVQAWVEEEEFIKEVADEIEKLNGRPTSLDRCLKAYQQYQAEESDEARQHLKETYEAVPEHLRMFLGDMDVKDIPIRMIIYGEDEIENWSHRKMARHLGLKKLPGLDVKGVLKKKRS